MTTAVDQSATEAPAINRRALEFLQLEELAPSKYNPAGRMKAAEVEELADSIRKHGVMQAILVRPIKGKKPFEIVAGHRRFAGALLAGLTEIPATVRKLSDQEALELQLVENVQRLDLHPLEEANGYYQLSRLPGYDVAKIAARVGRSPKYIYDRIKLLALTKEAQKAFLEGEFTAGHAILLARLTPADQKRAMDKYADALFTYEEAGLFSTGGKHGDSFKATSVREFQNWVDNNVRLDVAAKDLPDLFPETHAALTQAETAADKIVPITHESRLEGGDRGAARIYLDETWHRADGQLKSKKCDRSALGVVVVGDGRGETFRVCVDHACTIHFPPKPKVKSGSAQKASNSAAAARKNNERQRWQKAIPALVEAIAAKVKQASATPQGPLGKMLLTALRSGYHRPGAAAGERLVPPGRTAEDLVRHLAMSKLAVFAFDFYERTRFTAVAKALGVDPNKHLEKKPEKVQTSAPAAAAKKGKAKVARAKRPVARKSKKKAGRR
jgi:ParB/RepB/Spo0J family partition protein